MTSSTSLQLFKFLKTGGEMGKLIHALDWDKTSLGPINTWPSSLRNILTTALHSPFPMKILWGKDLLCFYNDGFIPLLSAGNKHPFVLGKSAKEAFAEQLEVVGPLLNQVLSTGAPVKLEDHLYQVNCIGKMEDQYWTSAYSAIFNDNNEIAGVLVVYQDTTEKVQRFISFINQSKEPIVLLKGENLIVEEANQATLDLWRVARENTIGRAFTDVLPIMKDQAFPEMLLKVYRTGETINGYEVPAYLERANGQTEFVYFNFEYSPYKDSNGNITGVLVIANEVTGQVMAKREQTIAEEEMRMAIDAAGLGYWNVDPIKNTFNCNDQTRKLFGLPPEDDIDLNVAINAIHIDDREKVIGAIQNALDGKNDGKYEIEYKVVSETNSCVFELRAVGQAYFNDDKVAYRFSGTVEDISAKNAEKRILRESEARFQAAVDAVNGIIWTNDAEGRMMGEQPGWSELTGQSKKEYEGYGWASALHPDDAQPTIDAWNQVVNDRKTFVFEHRIKTKNGDWRLFAVRAVPVINADNSIREWVGVHTDITDQRAAEDRIKESESRFRALANQSPAFMFVSGADAQIRFINDSWIKFTGLSPENALGLGWTKVTHPDDLQRSFEIYNHGFTTRTSYQYEMRQYDNEGKLHWILWTGTPRFLANGEYLGILGLGIDITDRKNAEETLQYRKALLEAQNEAIPDSILIVDTKGKILSHNKHFGKLWGIPQHIIDAEDDNAALEYAMTMVVDPEGFISRVQQSYAHPHDMAYDEVLLTDGRILERFGNAVTGEDGTDYGWVWYFRDVTAARQQQQRLEESENRYRNIFESVPVALFEEDFSEAVAALNTLKSEHKGKIRQWLIKHPEVVRTLQASVIVKDANKQALQLFEADQKHQLLGGLLSVKNEESLVIFVDELLAIANGEKEFNGEYILRTINGNKVHCLVSLANPNNNISSVLVSMYNITQRIETEAALLESEKQFRDFSNNIQNLAWIADGEGLIYWYNQRWYDYTGTHLEEIRGWGWEKVHHPEHRDRTVSFIKSAWNKGEPWELTFPLRSAIGEYQWFLTRAVPIKNDEGKVLRWIGTNTNINEQKNLSEKLEDIVLERTQELSQSKSFLQSVLNSAQSTISTFESIRDNEGRIVDFRLTFSNYLIEKELGQKLEDMIGKTCREIFPHMITSCEMEKFIACVESGEVIKYETRYDHNGKTLWYFVSLAKMGDGLTTTSLNITKEKEAAEKLANLNKELDDRNQELQRSNAELQQYAYISSHDLQEPLRKISIFVQRIQRDDYDGLNENSKIIFEKIIDATERMRQSLRDLLDYASLDQIIKLEPVNLNAVMAMVLKDLEGAIQEKDAKVLISELPVVRAIPLQMNQLFYNLLGNALKYSRVGVTPVVKVSSQIVDINDKNKLVTTLQLIPGKYYEFIIEDNGIGFEEEYAEQIFVIFKRLHTRHEFGGTGIGLALCKKVAQNHGGGIYATSVNGKGSSFHVLIPGGGLDG